MDGQSISGWTVNAEPFRRPSVNSQRNKYEHTPVLHRPLSGRVVREDQSPSGC